MFRAAARAQAAVFRPAFCAPRWYASKSGLPGIEKITFVKKIKMDGTPCKKCGQVSDQLEKADQMKMIDEIIIADERDDESPGMVMAKKLDVTRAPFFVVDREDGKTDAYVIYFEFVKKVLKAKTEKADELKEMMQSHRDVLDAI